MKLGLRVSLVLGVFGSTSISTLALGSTDGELLYSAPIEQLDRATNKITVLGQDFDSSANGLNLGQIVNVYGTLQKDGSVADAVVEPTDSYGANGDAVFVKGVVTDADPALGRIKVDGLSVDYTGELGTTDFSLPSVGDVVAVAGTQPAVKGVLVASAMGARAYQASITGNLQTAGITGSRQSAGITGSLQTAGITGSRQSAGITGSLQTAGITGSRQSAGITGSLQTAGITGSRQSAGITGSLQTAGITGSLRSAGITGSKGSN